MASRYKDGWYPVVGDAVQVLVKNGKVITATKGRFPASVYRWQGSAYVDVCPISYRNFLRGWNSNRLSIISII